MTELSVLRLLLAVFLILAGTQAYAQLERPTRAQEPDPVIRAIDSSAFKELKIAMAEFYASYGRPAGSAQELGWTAPEGQGYELRYKDGIAIIEFKEPASLAGMRLAQALYVDPDSSAFSWTCGRSTPAARATPTAGVTAASVTTAPDAVLPARCRGGSTTD